MNFAETFDFVAEKLDLERDRYVRGRYTRIG